MERLLVKSEFELARVKSRNVSPYEKLTYQVQPKSLHEPRAIFPDFHSKNFVGPWVLGGVRRRFSEVKSRTGSRGANIIDGRQVTIDTCITNEEQARFRCSDGLQDEPSAKRPGLDVARKAQKPSQVCRARYEPEHATSNAYQQRYSVGGAGTPARTTRIIQEGINERRNRRVSQRRALTHHTCSLLDTESINAGGSSRQATEAVRAVFQKHLEARHGSPGGARRCLGIYL